MGSHHSSESELLEFQPRVTLISNPQLYESSIKQSSFQGIIINATKDRVNVTIEWPLTEINAVNYKTSL